MRFHTIALGAVFLISTTTAGADFAGTIAVTSDYDYRGFSQTAGDIALQGSLDYSHDSGFYASAWGSTLDWGDDSDAKIEIDYIVGFSRPVGDGEVSWDVGLLYYSYPNLSSVNFLEIYGGFSAKYLNFKVSYSDDFAGVGESAWYIDGGFNYGWENGWSVLAYGGYSFGSAFDRSKGLALGVPDYFNWGAGVGYTWKSAYIELKAVDTTLNGIYVNEDGVFENDLRGILSVTVSIP